MRKKYVKKITTENDISRKDWRVSKKLLKDKAKREGVVGHLSDGVPPWIKRLCNKLHRQ